jgi:hypothetical protein
MGWGRDAGRLQHLDLQHLEYPVCACTCWGFSVSGSEKPAGVSVHACPAMPGLRAAAEQPKKRRRKALRVRAPFRRTQGVSG